jgi:hypothetical protein
VFRRDVGSGRDVEYVEDRVVVLYFARERAQAEKVGNACKVGARSAVFRDAILLKKGSLRPFADSSLRAQRPHPETCAPFTAPNPRRVPEARQLRPVLNSEWLLPITNHWRVVKMPA